MAYDTHARVAENFHAFYVHVLRFLYEYGRAVVSAVAQYHDVAGGRVDVRHNAHSVLVYKELVAEPAVIQVLAFGAVHVHTAGNDAVQVSA